jgi:predicted transcriptional regulator
MKKTKNKFIGFKIDEETKEKLEKIAEERHVDMSHLARQGTLKEAGLL